MELFDYSKNVLAVMTINFNLIDYCTMYYQQIYSEHHDSAYKIMIT